MNTESLEQFILQRIIARKEELLSDDCAQKDGMMHAFTLVELWILQYKFTNMLPLDRCKDE